jgi:hypothetical protein
MTTTQVCDEMFNVAFHPINDVQNAYELMIKSIVNLGIENAGEIAFVLDALKKDKSSILGIAKKVNK